MTRILVLDDDRAVLNYLNVFLLQTGEFDVTLLSDSTQAVRMLGESTFDILLLDMDMPEVTGLDILKAIDERGIDVSTIVLTGVEDIELAVSAMKLGAHDYLTKPVNTDTMLNAIRSALELRSSRRRAAEEAPVLESLAFPDAFREIVTADEQMFRIFRTVEKLAPSENTILIWGESGTGKELIARVIHRLSKRSDRPFVAVNAGVFADELFASEFFGHEKGAFTGAHTDKRGFLEEADQGTLFLDEIGELALPIQVKLLRVLQEGEFFRIGSTKNRKVDVRIIAATNKNLFEETKKGNFRKDLFYRLNMNSIYLPPLKERKGDIPLLAEHFLRSFSQQAGKNIERISEPAMKALMQYEYPGNIRELMNIINSGVIIESSTELRKKSLPQYFLESVVPEENGAKGVPQKTLREVEREHIARVLQYTGGNKTHAAKILGISRVGLISKVKQYGLE
ncbi:MAG: sigma-54 dependent transcriptional regulator [Bacteroidota bacterium]|nr:sigma-54 dependent transcriptional regulator [Bacteroidota bacterium]